MRRLLLSAVAATVVGLTVPGGAPLVSAAPATATTCLAAAETRNSWHTVPVPATGAHVAADADDPCSMSAATSDGRTWRSADGGRSWQRTGNTPGAVRDVYRTGLPNDVVLALPVGAGLYVSRDSGTTWKAASGLTGVRLAGVSTEIDNRTGVWAAGVHESPVASVGDAPTGSVFSSTDGGTNWNEDARGLPIHPSVVARLGAPYHYVFANDVNTQELWQRSDTGAFSPAYSDDVHALAVSPLKGGGSELYVAAAGGLVVTRDGGSAFSKMSKGAASSVAAEYNHYSAFMYVSGGVVLRSTNGGRTARAVRSGLSSGCDPAMLSGDHLDPTTFLLRCADGSVHRYRSDGSDLLDTDAVSSDTAGGGPGPLDTLTPTPMALLSTLKLPAGKGNSASIAYDGTYLYYASSKNVGVVHRVVSATGTRAPDLRLPGTEHPVISLTYDSKRHVMYFVDATTETSELNLRTGRVRHLFRGPYQQSTCDGCTIGPEGSLTYDTSNDQFVFISDQGVSPTFYSRSGRPIRTCTISSQGLVSGGSMAGIVAAGDGGLYAEGEDDSSVYRLDRNCHLTAVYQHAAVNEAPDENDAIACDTTTFPQAAIWIRDAAAATATAYAVPDGYCALATTMTVSAPSSVSTGSAGTVCAHLHRLGTGGPVVGNAVQMFVANRQIGSVPTDATGTACAAYQPTAAEAGRGPKTAITASTRAHQPVVAAFLGTKAFRPASARVALAALDAGTPATRPALAAVAAAAGLPAAPGAVAAPPTLVAPPAPPAPPAAQPQPLPQAHPGAQPGAAPMGQPGAAFQQEQEAEAATANIRSDEFRARPAPAVAPDLRVVVPVGVVLASAVARRRRASRVRSQVT